MISAATMRFCAEYVFLLLVFSSAARQVKFKDCGSEGTHVQYVSVSPCTSEPCPLVHFSTIQVSIKFLPTVGKDQLTAYLTGIVGGMPVPFPLPDPDACASELKCPVVPGRSAVYNETISVDPVLPDVNVTLQWELKDNDYGQFMCVQFPAYIT